MRLGESLRWVAQLPYESRFEALQKHVPEDWIDEALDASGVATMRRRRLPAEQVVWLVLGMALFHDLPIEAVVDRLNIALPDRGQTPVAKSAIPPARSRVGAEPLERLFSKTAVQWGHASADRDRWQGLALYGVDGTTIRVPDSRENRQTFGNTRTHRDCGESGYPMVRLVTLTALRSHVLAAARFEGAGIQSEYTLATSLWSEIPDRSIAIVDRGFFSADVLCGLTSNGRERHWVIRARRNSVWKTIERLGRHDELVELTVSASARRKNPNLPRTFQARAIRYRHAGSPESILLTSLLDPKRFRSADVVRLYHERWEIELGYDEIKTHLLESGAPLRSRSAAGIRQELWGVLLLYNLIRLEMERSAADLEIPPSRISFVHALRAIQNEWTAAGVLYSPGTAGVRLRRLRDDLKRLVLPPRRERRRFPRAVKVKMSNYARKRPVLK